MLKHLDAPKFVFLSVLTIIETSCPKKWAKPLSKNEKNHFRLTCVAQKRLCLSSLLAIQHHVYRHLDDSDSNAVPLFTMDLSKAFDYINHGKLSAKLKQLP